MAIVREKSKTKGWRYKPGKTAQREVDDKQHVG